MGNAVVGYCYLFRVEVGWLARLNKCTVRVLSMCEFMVPSPSGFQVIILSRKPPFILGESSTIRPCVWILSCFNKAELPAEVIRSCHKVLMLNCSRWLKTVACKYCLTTNAQRE